jgi:hypothetical protein
MEDWRGFEGRAREVLGRALARELRKRTIPFPGSHAVKEFDLVSDDGQVVGEAKSMATGTSQDSGKLMEITAHVLMLQRLGNDSRLRILVFRHPELPSKWLTKGIAPLADGVELIHLDVDGRLSDIRTGRPWTPES